MAMMLGTKIEKRKTMTDSMYNYIKHDSDKGKAIKLWNKGVPVADNAITQMKDVAEMPFIYKHVAGMPDVHLGKGATVGSVIATKGAIIPAAVGVDIGCGMMAYRTTLRAVDLPHNLKAVRSAIEAAVPHGRTDNGGKNDKGSFTKLSDNNAGRWRSLADTYDQIVEKHPKAKAFNTFNHIGTLGTGNHFIELCLDEEDYMWIMLHSGSRGLGNRIGSYFIEKAKEEMRRYHILDNLPNQDLAYLVENTDIFEDYMGAVDFAQDFAYENRKAIMQATIGAIRKTLPNFTLTDLAINCHHNYISKEHHFGQNVWITRKGSLQAREGTMGIIPGSMGTASYIVSGKGNPDSFCSCSHGAGRVMSRTEAHKTITLDQHKVAMVGVEARLDTGVIDESPAAYKPIEAVMNAQSDLVDIKFKLHQIVNVKG